MFLSSRWVRLFAALVVMSSAIAAGPVDNPERFAPQALELADAVVPELADAIKNCSVDEARGVHGRIQDFIYKKWSWSANYEKLKPYRACFQMLTDLAATTQLVTNRFAEVRPHLVAGPFDANYSACRKLADPSYELKEAAINAKWPSRLGPEPKEKKCSQGAALSSSR